MTQAEIERFYEKSAFWAEIGKLLGQGATALGGFGAKGGVEATKFAATTLVVAPILLGIAGGAMHSALTSPSVEKDLEQKRLVAADLDATVAHLKRQRRANQLAAQRRKGLGDERTLHL
jgi:hypothetical protein